MTNKEISDLKRKEVLYTRYVSNEGYVYTVTEYVNAYNCTIMFDDKYKTTLYNLQYNHVRSGQIRNPNHTSIQGVCKIGQGKYTCKNSKKAYTTWMNMIRRCINEQHKSNYINYKDVTLCDEWHNFQNFAEWHEENYNPETMQGWALDKDILVKNNKIYSPETCCFVPPEINSLLVKRLSKRGEYCIGVNFHKHAKKFQANMNKKYLGSFNTEIDAFNCYKLHKEKDIKEVADKWRDQISPKVYQALYNYQVEITD